MPNSHEILKLFKSNAAKVSTTVLKVKNLQEAAEYALSLCVRSKAQCSQKNLALTGIPDQIVASVQDQAAKQGINIIRNDLRSCLKDIYVGLSMGDMAIADTASILMSSYDEDPRLASMLSEIHVIAVAKANIVKTLDEAENYLREVLAGAMYTAFISGCSRTSDIERVLTLGVHGPLELHVALLEEA